MKGSARMQAGSEQGPVADRSVVGEKPTPGPQAELVRKAIARNPLALIVEPADPADLETRECGRRGGRPGNGAAVVVPSSDRDEVRAGEGSGTTAAAVRSSGCAPSRSRTRPRELVAAAVNNARNAKLGPRGRCGPPGRHGERSPGRGSGRGGTRGGLERRGRSASPTSIRYASVAADAEKKLGDLLEADRQGVHRPRRQTSTQAAFGSHEPKGRSGRSSSPAIPRTSRNSPWSGWASSRGSPCSRPTG